MYLTSAFFRESLIVLVVGFLLIPTLTQACELEGISIPEIQPALANGECRSSEYLSEVPYLGTFRIRSLDFVFDPITREFRGKMESAINARQLLRLDGDSIRAEYERAARERISHGCAYVALSNFHFTSDSDGVLHAQVQVNYQARLCTNSTCYQGWNKWPPYPIYAKCVAKADVPGGDATLVVHTLLRPRLVPRAGDQVDLEVVSTSSFEVTKRISNELKNIVGIGTLGIGSKYINDKYRAAINDFRASLAASSGAVGIARLPRVRQANAQVRFQLQNPIFRGNETALEFVIESATVQDPAVACDIRQEAIRAQKFFQSCATPQTEYSVQAGDTLWSIADRIYGDGQYYHVVASANDLRKETQDRLTPGQRLLLRPYFRLVDEDQVLVEAGDTLWELAERELGNGARYRELTSEATEVAGDPQSLSTLLSLQLPQGNQQ